jgi:hypothetical protein
MGKGKLVNTPLFHRKKRRKGRRVQIFWHSLFLEGFFLFGGDLEKFKKIEIG